MLTQYDIAQRIFDSDKSALVAMREISAAVMPVKASKFNSGIKFVPHFVTKDTRFGEMFCDELNYIIDTELKFRVPMTAPSKVLIEKIRKSVANNVSGLKILKIKVVTDGYKSY